MRANLETTNDAHPVEQPVSIRVGGVDYKFAVIVPRYVHAKLTSDDWLAAGQQLPKERDRHVSNAVLAGTYFTDAGFRDVLNRVRQSMCDLVYQRFQTRQIEAGNEAWAVPETLQRVTQ